MTRMQRECKNNNASNDIWRDKDLYVEQRERETEGRRERGRDRERREIQRERESRGQTEKKMRECQASS